MRTNHHNVVLFIVINVAEALQGQLGSIKVVDFGTNRKSVGNLLLVINSNLWSGPILHRFGDTVA